MVRFLAVSLALLALVPAGSAHPGKSDKTVPLSLIPAIDDAPTKAHDYDWLGRHNAVLARVHSGPVGMVLIGDSITHGWGGDPEDPNKKGGGPRDLWNTYFAPRSTVNLGFGWDRTEHVLWRIQHGELDHIQPKVAVIMIGTNNIWRDSAADIAAGIGEVVHETKQKLRRTKIVLFGIFPRDHEVDTANRKKLKEVNQMISSLGSEPNVTFLDIGDKFLESDGTLSQEVMPDFLHPNHRGYEIWASQLEPALIRLLEFN